MHVTVQKMFYPTFETQKFKMRRFKQALLFFFFFSADLTDGKNSKFQVIRDNNLKITKSHSYKAEKK